MVDLHRRRWLRQPVIWPKRSGESDSRLTAADLVIAACHWVPGLACGLPGMTIGGKRRSKGNSSREGLCNQLLRAAAPHPNPLPARGEEGISGLLRAPGMGYSDANPDKKAGLSVTVEENV